jgi:hypothetical protein
MGPCPRQLLPWVSLFLFLHKWAAKQLEAGPYVASQAEAVEVDPNIAADACSNSSWDRADALAFDMDRVAG